MNAERRATAPEAAEVISSAGPRASTPLGEGRASVPHRWTSATLTGGVIVSAACFLVAVAAELLGVDSGGGEMTDVGALAKGLVALTPWAWASLGTLAVVVTPALGLLTTACEYASVGDRRTILLALAVLTVLLLSAVVAILR